MPYLIVVVLGQQCPPPSQAVHKVYGTMENIPKIIINHSKNRSASNLEYKLYGTLSNCPPNFRRIDRWLIGVLKFGI